MSTGYRNPQSGFEKSELILHLINLVKANKLHQMPPREAFFLLCLPWTPATSFNHCSKAWMSRTQLPSLRIAGCSSPSKPANIPLKTLSSPPEVTNNIFYSSVVCHLMIFKTFGKINQLKLFYWGEKKETKQTKLLVRCHKIPRGCSKSTNDHLIPPFK